jgi:hypothetical protein
MPSAFDAGNGQTIVVYVSPDTGTEVNPAELYAAVARDAADRAAGGERIVSMSASPLRHSAVKLGREGSGYESKLCIAVVYARS